jgi:hypothetical protein
VSEFLPADTSPEAWEMQNEAYRRMGGTARLAIAMRLTQFARETALAGIRVRHPLYSEDEVHRAFARLRLGDDLVREIWPDRDLVDP